MKANEAPEKIYIDPEVDPMCDMNKRFHESDIEYTRTDAFIEKACSGIEKLLSGYIIKNFNFGDSYDIDKLIEDFRNYIEK